MTVTIGFTGNRLDRADHLREDEGALAGATADWRARLLALDGLSPVLDDRGELAWVSLAEAGDADELILLGLEEGRPRFAALPPDPPVSPQRDMRLWGVLGALPPGQAALYACARTLIDWHARHGFCARCGGGTRVFRAGWGRRCDACSTEHYPRVDPVVIMLAECGDQVLLGRQHAWPTGRFSALAGFVEPGESIEEAVTRELHEEAGVVATSVRYVASQPWPFPSQLMIAAIATVDDLAFRLDDKELQAALWVSRADVHAALAGAPDARFIAPPPMAIAHTLLTRWAGDEA